MYKVEVLSTSTLKTEDSTSDDVVRACPKINAVIGIDSCADAQPSPGSLPVKPHCYLNNPNQ